jgi:ATP-dependent DNA ligase
MTRGFVEPMLASPTKEGMLLPSGEWIAQEKYDGHRLIVAVGKASGLFGGEPRAWSRDAKDRILPAHVRTAIGKLPNGIYDGELLVPGERSYGVTRLDLADKLVFVCFDVLELLGKDLTIRGIGANQQDRRDYLLQIFNQPELGVPGIQLAWQMPIKTFEDANRIAARDVWSRDGEGLILKRVTGLYQPGKRPKDWLKIKMLRSACLTIVGFKAGTMGDNSVVMLRDDDGNDTTVKWKNLEILHQLQTDPKSFIGRKLWIEFQERTPDGGYRHPRWDHLDEGRNAGKRVLSALKGGTK